MHGKKKWSCVLKNLIFTFRKGRSRCYTYSFLLTAKGKGQLLGANLGRDWPGSSTVGSPGGGTGAECELPALWAEAQPVSRGKEFSACTQQLLDHMWKIHHDFLPVPLRVLQLEWQRPNSELNWPEIHSHTEQLRLARALQNGKKGPPDLLLLCS